MATVYVHVGLPKTGTTALQQFLWKNGETLEKYGITYPHTEYRYEGVGFYRNGHFLVAPYVDENGKAHHDQPCREFGEALDHLKSLGEKFDTILLSDEIIWRTRWKWKDYWQRIRQEMNSRGLELKVIVYLRRQDLWTESFWAQMVKGGGSTHSFDDFFERFVKNTCYVDYYDYMKHLAPVIGDDNLIIRVYERGQFRGKEGTLHSDFLDIFGLSIEDGFNLKGEVQNTRLDGAYLEIRRLLNTVPDSPAGGALFKNSLRGAQDADLPEGHFAYFSAEGRKAYMKLFEEDNRRLAREFLGREDGVLFREEIEDTPQFSDSDRELLKAAVCTFGRMADELARKNKELKEKNRKLTEKTRKLESDIRALREDVVWYRLKRKTRHILGKEGK